VTNSDHDPRGVLFDIDGTLVDSNYLHIAAWIEAFQSVGRDVPAWKIHRATGMDSSLMLDELLGDDADELGEPAKKRHSEVYSASASELRVLPGARDLIKGLAGRGVRVVLATSAPEEELKLVRTVLDVEDHIDAVTSAQDVDQAKPDPGIVDIAQERSGCSSDRLIFVGDATWDIKAAGRAGLEAIGVLTGGISADELTGAGAKIVCEGAAEVADWLSRDPRFR